MKISKTLPREALKQLIAAAILEVQHHSLQQRFQLKIVEQLKYNLMEVV